MTDLEWIECDTPWYDFDAQPGMLVEVGFKDEVSTETYLIGDINTLAGVCDDCTAFKKSTTTVIRYAVVWRMA